MIIERGGSPRPIDKFITNDINEIIKFILGETATFTDTNSFETLIDFVFSKNYKYDNILFFSEMLAYNRKTAEREIAFDKIGHIHGYK